MAYTKPFNIHYPLYVTQRWLDIFPFTDKKRMKRLPFLAEYILAICITFLVSNGSLLFAYNGGDGTGIGKDSGSHLEEAAVIKGRLYGTDTNGEVQGNYGDGIVLGSLSDDRLKGDQSEYPVFCISFLDSSNSLMFIQNARSVADSESHFEEPKVIKGRLYGTDANEELSASQFNVTEVQGNYGNDTVLGSLNDDRLNGGHGKDRLIGNAGRDLLISRSDGREPPVAQKLKAVDDPRNEINPITRTLYRDQPIEADDVMIGGLDADTFRFEVLINAKKRIILKHAQENGKINWSGVAGENNRIHDHWVDRIGDEMILDFSRAEGDKIEIVGHTADVYKVLHQDSNNNGILDSTVLYVQANQGNGGGAHDKDKLGTISVFGDLVTRSDYIVNSGRNFGIVDTIDELEQALKPRVNTGKDDGMPPQIPELDEGELPDGAVLLVPGELTFRGKRGDHIEVEHNTGLELSEGTVALRFTANNVSETHTMFSKDASGQEIGGHLTASVKNGRISVRLQSVEESDFAESREGSVLVGKEHHMAVTFGSDGFQLYLDGKIVYLNAAFPQDIATNMENLVIGANTGSRNNDNPFRTSNNFDGNIKDFTVYDSQLDANEIAELAEQMQVSEQPSIDPIKISGRLYGTDNDELLGVEPFAVNDIFAGYGNDTVLGSSDNDRLNGGHGLDRLEGRDGNDILVSRSDGREPTIAQEFGADDDPENEIDRSTRTFYSDQPIEADDVLIGGAGADTFRFVVLINAKRNIILKHTKGNGRINWDGVAGENDRVHDHWVDRIGDEMIVDFNSSEGDKIEIVGHTVDVYKVEYQDIDNDNVLDSTVLYLQANQGNGGGAHNKDKLGTINVFGGIVTGANYTVDRKNYGIVETIAELDEALTPRIHTGQDDGTPPQPPNVNDGELPENGVLLVPGVLTFDGEKEDQIELDHFAGLELKEGTIALNFIAEDVSNRRALFSKDASGQEIGGHLTAIVQEGRVEVRLQSVEKSVNLRTALDSVKEGVEYHLAVTFGPDGFWIHLNGRVAGLNSEFTQSIDTNMEKLVIGANIGGRSKDNPERAQDYFYGQIENLTVYDRQFDQNEVTKLAEDSKTNDQDQEDDQEDETLTTDPTMEILATPTIGSAPLTVNFTAKVSLPDGTKLTYLWNFGDDSDVSIDQNPVHIYNQSGTYTATVTVQNDKGETVSADVDIAVLPDLPVEPNPLPQPPIGIGDTQPPVIDNCPDDIVIVNDRGRLSAIVSWPEPTATDNVSVVSIVSSHLPGNRFRLGTTTVTYTATDAAGNSDVCTFKITVVFKLKLRAG